MADRSFTAEFSPANSAQCDAVFKLLRELEFCLEEPPRSVFLMQAQLFILCENRLVESAGTTTTQLLLDAGAPFSFF